MIPKWSSLLALVIVLSVVCGQGRRNRPFRFHNRRFNNGGYNFGFDTDDGISRTETGQFVENGPGQKQWQVRGSYQYFDPNQQLFRVNYVADTNGYVPTIEKMPELLPTTTPQAPITLSPFRTAEGVFTEAPAVAEDEEEGGGLLDDRLAPNLVKSLVG